MPIDSMMLTVLTYSFVSLSGVFILMAIAKWAYSWFMVWFVQLLPRKK